MRKIIVLALSLALAESVALAQHVSSPGDPTNNPAVNSGASKASTGAPAQTQPQGPTGPTNTTSGGAPAGSPQGDAPAGMQSDPRNPKQHVAPKK